MRRFKSTKDATDAITYAIVRGVHDYGDAVFKVSQENVPVDKGVLKASGEIEHMPNGIRIVYNTPYAWIRENIVPKKTKQVAPRGTFYLKRSIADESLLVWVRNSLKRLE